MATYFNNVLITLLHFRFLGIGDSYQTIDFSFHCDRSTVGIIVPETCKALWNILQPLYMETPDVNKWRRISRDFFQKWDFPNCLWSIDGKHVSIKKPASSGSLYYNYKKQFSIVLMAVVDANYRFIAVDIGAFGRQSAIRNFSQFDIWAET